MAPARDVGLVTTGYPHLGDPVAGAFVRAMARALAARGHRVRVVCVARRERDRWDAPLADPGVDVTAARYPLGETFYGAGAPDALRLGVRGAPWRAWAGAPLAVGALLAACARTLRGVDAVVSHFALPCGPVASLATRARHVMVAHGTDGWLLARAPRAVQRAVLGGADVVWYTHAALRGALDHPARVRSVVRPMGWEVDALPPRTSAPQCRLLCLSRLVPVKRVERAIDAASLLRARGVDVSLTVAGDGPERARLEARAAGLGGAARFEGRVDAARRARLFADSDVFVHTAGALPGGRTEGAPVSVLEAMGASLPVVACDAGGVREVVGDGGVVLSAGASARDLADAVASLAGDAALRKLLSERAFARAWPLRWEATAAWMEGLFDQPPGDVHT